jgi:hypothetical protein
MFESICHSNIFRVVYHLRVEVKYLRCYEYYEFF